MITTVTYRPSYQAGAYNPIIWTFYSNQILQTDFKYVIDLYKDGVFILRFKQRPNPAGYGMFDISTVAQGYLIDTSPNGPLTQGETTINYTLGKLFQSNGDMSANFYIKVGEEYSTGGVLQIYNGVTQAVGAPQYAIYSGSTALANTPVHVWPSTVDYRRQQYAMSNYYSLSGAYGVDPITNKVYDHGLASTIDRLAYPLMWNELEQDLYAFDKMVLSFINWSPYNADANKRTIYGFRYTFKNSAGATTFTSDVVVTSVTGSGPRLNCTDNVASQIDSQYGLLHVLASPNDVAQALATTAPVGGTLEIQGFTKDSSCNFGAAITEKVVINIQEYCDTTLYPRVRLSWLNTLGGRDYMNFTMLTEKTVSATSEKYTQEEINWSASTPVQTLQTEPVSNLATLGGDKIYNKEITTSYKIATDWLTQEQVDLLEGLLKSSQVLAYIHTGAAFDDDFPYQVNVKQAAYTSKNIRQNKVTQATFDIDVTLTEKIQNT